MNHRTAALLLITALCCRASLVNCASDADGQPLTIPAAVTGPGCSLIFKANSSQSVTVLCPDTRVILAEFPYVTSSGVTNISFSASALNIVGSPVVDPNVACIVSSSGAGSGSTAYVNCTRNDGSPYPTNSFYKVLLTASFSCGSGPSSEANTSANFTVADSPQITIQQQGPAQPFVCSDATTVSVDYSFNVTASTSAGKIILGGQQLQQQRLAAAASSVAGTSCTVKIVPGPPTIVGSMFVIAGTATVSCQGTLLKPPSALDLNLVLSARLEGCAPITGTAKTRVLVQCCKQGRSYARQRRVGQRQAKCFSHYLPGTTSSDCGNSSAVFGLYNQGPATAKMSLLLSNTTGCTSQVTLGKAVMSCGSSNKKLVSFSLRIIDTNIDPAADQQFLLSCSPPTRKAGTCPGNVQWQSVQLKGQGRTSILTADGFKVTTFSAALPDAVSCDCQDAVWAVYESGVFRDLPNDMCA